LWQILVLGVVRLGLDANYDRLEHLANYDTLIRQFLGVPAAPTGAVCPAPGFFGKSEGARLAVRAISGERP